MWKNFSPSRAIATSSEFPSKDTLGEPMTPVPASSRRRGLASGPGFKAVELAANLRRARQIKFGVRPRPVADAKAHAPRIAAQRHIHAAILAEKRHRFGPGEIRAGLRQFEPGLQRPGGRLLAGFRPRQFTPRRHAHRPDHPGVVPLRPFDIFRMRVIHRLAFLRHAPGSIRDEFERRLAFASPPGRRR